MSPDSYLAPDADVEPTNLDLFLENNSQMGTMSDDDDTGLGLRLGIIVLRTFADDKLSDKIF